MLQILFAPLREAVFSLLKSAPLRLCVRSIPTPNNDNKESLTPCNIL